MGDIGNGNSACEQQLQFPSIQRDEEYDASLAMTTSVGFSTLSASGTDHASTSMKLPRGPEKTVRPVLRGNDGVPVCSTVSELSPDREKQIIERIDEISLDVCWKVRVHLNEEVKQFLSRSRQLTAAGPLIVSRPPGKSLKSHRHH